ncbi:MAG: type I-MYXAN CRISPR-associated protein Cas6/Cmx6 [Gammaproteobacteria bacterium]|nr:type I-MYXAN CRISPR-associated protein Cas6/Cmx6 [Gammaproteobacteria bacterium]
MYWQESPEEQEYELTDEVMDLSFKLIGSSIPVDHAYVLSQSLCEVLPWLEGEPEAGIHLIHVANSANGWQRPENPEDLLHLSRRARLTLRLPKHRLAEAEQLQGQTLNMSLGKLTLGETSRKKLSKLTTVFSRYIEADKNQDEDEFLTSVVARLTAMDISVRKMLSGLSHRFETPQGPLFTRSLMLADLDVKESVRLQRLGLGGGRKMGCGLFIPHKGIEAVNKTQQMK